MTLRTVELLMDYERGAYLERISPTPLLMVVAAGDHLTPVDLALGAYARALEPKQLVVLPGGHFEAYVGPGLRTGERRRPGLVRTASRFGRARSASPGCGVS